MAYLNNSRIVSSDSNLEKTGFCGRFRGFNVPKTTSIATLQTNKQTNKQTNGSQQQ